MKIIIDGLEEGQVAVVAVMGADFYPEEDPDPGEEEEEGPTIASPPPPPPPPCFVARAASSSIRRRTTSCSSRSRCSTLVAWAVSWAISSAVAPGRLGSRSVLVGAEAGPGTET